MVSFIALSFKILLILSDTAGYCSYTTLFFNWFLNENQLYWSKPWKKNRERSVEKRRSTRDGKFLLGLRWRSSLYLWRKCTRLWCAAPTVCASRQTREKPSLQIAVRSIIVGGCAAIIHFRPVKIVAHDESPYIVCLQTFRYVSWRVI